MNEFGEGVKSSVLTTFDAMQHCTAVRSPHENKVAMDCPYTGKGEEFSPTNLVEAALAGCMMISMGTLAMRHEIDLTGTTVDVKISMTDKPILRFGAIDVIFKMPRNLDEKDRVKLERAADSCPIKHSFAEDVKITVRYDYPE